MPASSTASARRIKDVNTRYHDVAALDYDSKWGIDFGTIGQRQVETKLTKALGGRPRPFADALEIGAGTGYFAINLLQLGLIERVTATDISAGMLSTLSNTAARLGLEVSTVQTEAEQLPFGDRSFDIVFGHAVLHHIPDPDRAFAEFNRVLRPGGTIAFCGEPSRYGDRLAALPKQAGGFLAPAWRRALGASDRLPPVNTDCNGHALEGEVDVHAFSAGDLRLLLKRAGFEQRRVRGEELLANAWGWSLRSLEATAAPDSVPLVWRRFAFRSYLLLQRIDAALLEPRLPAELFYNLLLSGRKPLAAG